MPANDLNTPENLTAEAEIDKVGAKQIMAEAKKWQSLFKQAIAAGEKNKGKRAEQLALDALRSARRAKALQLQFAPNLLEASELVDRGVLMSVSQVGHVYFYQRSKKSAELALPMLLEACALLEKVAKPDHLAIIDTYSEIAETYAMLQDGDKSEEYFQLTLNAAENYYGQWHPKIVRYMTALATVLDERGAFEKSLSLKKDMLKICENDPETKPVEIMFLRHAIAFTQYLIAGVPSMEAVNKAMEIFSPEEKKLFTAAMAAEFKGLI